MNRLTDKQNNGRTEGLTEFLFERLISDPAEGDPNGDSHPGGTVAAPLYAVPSSVFPPLVLNCDEKEFD